MRQRSHLRGLFFFLATLIATSTAAGAPQQIPVEQRVVALVFANSMATWTGSGFAVGDGRWIVTNHHVATRKFNPEKYVVLHDAMVLSPWTGRAHRARVVAVDQQADLALLRLDSAVLPSLPLAPANFLEKPPPLPRPPVQLAGYPSVADRKRWEESAAAHLARSQGLGITMRNDVPVLMLAPVEGPAKGWSGGPAIWPATGAVVGVFNALVSFPQEPDRWLPQVISIFHLRSFLTAAGVDPKTLDRGTVPAAPRPAGAAAAFRHLIRITSASFADDWSVAEREARALAQLRSAAPESHRLLGTVLAGAGKHAEALKAFDQSRKLAPDSVPTLYQRAQALRVLGKVPEAEADLRRAAQIDPEHAETLLELGELLSESDRPAEARDLLRRAVRLSPNHPLIHWDLGLVLQRLGATEEGLAECKIAVDLTVDTEPLRPMRLAYARMLAQAGRAREAEREVREAVRLDKEDPTTHLALASLLAESGRKDEARQEAEKVLTLMPDDSVRRAASDLLKSLEPG